jgi:uncharacterized glyoxalase superfamily protein PhnB
MKNLIQHLTVKNVKETIRFYNNKLGFKTDFIQKDSNGNENFAILKNGSVEIMIGYTTANLKKLKGFGGHSASVVFYIELPDPDELYNKIKDDVPVIRHITDTQWNTREFWIEECNGYYLSFFKNIEL